jgi:lysophospholipase L1-like esterase
MIQHAPFRPTRRRLLQAAAALAVLLAGSWAPLARAGQESHGKPKWAATWAASSNGVYPTGTAVFQPSLARAFPSAATGANDQSFRMVVRPTLWGDIFRVRFTNAFGTQPVTIDGAYLGLHASSGAVVAGSNRPITFSGAAAVTIPPGTYLYSDPVRLQYVSDPDRFFLEGKKLAVSFHVAGQSGPMTWHSKAVQTSYVSAPGAGSVGHREDEAPFPFTTTSWYFIDAIEVVAAADAAVVVAFGDSITDGTASTLNGDDRWPDVLARRLHAAYGNQVALVNAGIGGNRVTGPTDPLGSVAGGPGALVRMERDVFSLAGVSAIVWLEGINDLSGLVPPQDVIAGYREGVRMARERGLKVIAATVTSGLNLANPTEANLKRDADRKVLNEFIRTAGIYDSVADFDAVTVDPATGALRPEMLPNSVSQAIDYLHPNRVGYQAMGSSVDISVLAPPDRGR